MSDEFSNPPTGGPPNAEPPNAEPKKRSLAALWIILAILVVVGVVIAFMVANRSDPAPGPSASATPTEESEQTETESPEPEPTEEPTTPPPDVGVVFPTTCEQLFDLKMLDEMPPLELNPPWTQDPELPPLYGTTDEALQQIIKESTHLTCTFAEPSGDETAINTNVVQTGEATQEQVIGDLEAMGQTCDEELDGTLCVLDVDKNEGTWGESHFLRDGIWLATAYADTLPKDYTEHMIESIWD